MHKKISLEGKMLYIKGIKMDTNNFFLELNSNKPFIYITQVVESQLTYWALYLHYTIQLHKYYIPGSIWFDTGSIYNIQRTVWRHIYLMFFKENQNNLF